MPARDYLGEPDALADLAAVLAEMEPLERAHWIDRLLPHQRRLVAVAVAKHMQAGWRADPASMANHLTRGSGDQYNLWPYVRLLSGKFVEAFDGTDPRQLWNMPSQYGKTTLLCTYGVPWALMVYPTWRLMYVTFDADKAVEEGGKARDFLHEHSSELGVRLRPDRRARGMWRTEAGGGLYCVGVHGGITGYPAEAVLGDDLIAGWQKAHSEAERNHVENVFRAQMRLRLQAYTNPMILAGTRWHEDDPTGRRLSATEVGTEHWTHIRLPARAEPYDPASTDKFLHTPDPLGRAPGEVLEPERFPDQEVQARADTLGSYLAAALEQQRPSPEEGTDIKREWIQLAATFPQGYDQELTSWDMKLKDKESGDYVAGGVWGRTGSELWLREVFRGQWDQATTINAIALAQVRYPAITTHVVENTGNGPEVMQGLRRPEPEYVIDDATAGKLGMTAQERRLVQDLRRRGMQGLLPENPKGDKRIRMRANIGIVEARHVHVPERAMWVPAYLDEVAAFPNGAHDDQVDMTSQALKRMGMGEATVQRTERQLGPTQGTGAGAPGGLTRPGGTPRPGPRRLR